MSINSIAEKFSIFTISAFISMCIGEIDGIFKALIICMMLDYITGLTKAFINKTLSSRMCFNGILKKILIICIVSVVHVLETSILNTDGFCRTTVIYFYLGNECLSIVENVGEMGVPIPTWLNKSITTLKEKGEKK